MDPLPLLLRCNVCDEAVSPSALERHIAGRNHAIKKKVAEFNEMNSQLGRGGSGSRVQACGGEEDGVSVMTSWIRSLHQSDFIDHVAHSGSSQDDRKTEMKG